MRVLICFITTSFLVSAVAAQERSGWSEFRSDADGFSVELPGTPKITAHDFGDGQSQKFFTVEVGLETHMVSVIQLKPGRVPANPDRTYFEQLMKAYTDGSKTTLRSSRMFSWAGQTAMEGIADDESATHVVDIMAVGDRVYLSVYAGAKGEETTSKATHLRDSFKLLAK